MRFARFFSALLCILLPFIAIGCAPQTGDDAAGHSTVLAAEYDESTGTISVFREGKSDAILTQNAAEDFRPYLHPIQAPDGNGYVTQYSPDHHKHQTGIYWAFTRVNGRDYFHNPEGDYWKRVSAGIVEAEGPAVKWRTVYDLLGEDGETVMTEMQTWTLQEEEGRYLLDLEWSGTAKTDVTIGEFDYGGLFLRMPWEEGIEGEAINAARDKNERAEGKRAMWLDVGMKVEGRDDLAHIAIFDHPDNAGFPQPWRVDGQLGVGPVRARMGDWTIANGETEVIRHRLVFYTGDLGDIALTDAWEEFSGNDGMYSTASLWGIAQQEGREAEFLTPAMAVESMTTLEGYEVNAWAAEPMITQPMAFTWDDKGRLWVAENRDYESRGTGFSASGDSRILILEDTDRDGEADSRKVFLEGIPFPAAIAVGFDGLFLGAPPHLMFIPDRNGDDVADYDDIEIRLTGWGIRDRHETINSLHWGPDGWLYGLEGFATPSKIRKPQPGEKLYRHNDEFPEDLLEADGVDIDGGVWRYHPIKDRFEVVAHGFSNPWGIDYDAKGQLFISACVIPHVFHVIPGGIYQRQGGQHFNPYVYSDIQTIVDHRHRSAHGGARVYQSDAFPEDQRGRLFMANIHEHAVLTDVLERKGSGFVARHGDDFMMANNAQWIGFSIEIGPEGAVYVLDWHDADICGKEVLDKDTGRIFRITPTNSLAEDWPGRYDDLAEMSDMQLAEFQVSKSDWHARRARVILQNRATKGAIDSAAADRLRAIYADRSNPDYRLRAMWGLHVTGLLTTETMVSALDDEDEYIRAWAVQLMTEDGTPADHILNRFASMAENDASPVVRKYLAAALQRLDQDARWNIAEGLLARSEDVDDQNIPLLTWFGIEPLVEANPERALTLAANSAIPLAIEHIARRAVDADEIETLIAHLEDAGPAQVHMLEGMRAGLEGRTDLTQPEAWEAVYTKLQRNRDSREVALEIAQMFGDTEAAQEMMTTLLNASAPADQRIRALNGLASQQREELIEELPNLIDSDVLRVDAIRAVAAYSEQRLGRALLDRYDHFSVEDKQEAVQAMASRPVYGWQLTEALQTEAIPKSDVPAYVARQLRRVVGNGFVEVWGPIDQLSSNKEAQYERYESMLTNEAIAAADPVAGRDVYQRTCSACHVMYGEGGTLGPDITGSNRANLDYLLSNILNPSEEIQDDYKMVIVTTRDGRTYLGNVAAENDRQLTLQTVGQEAVVINKSDIQTREVSPASIMPEGLLETLSSNDVLDLVSFLQTSEPVQPALE